MLNKKGLIVLVIVAIALILISVRLAISDSSTTKTNYVKGSGEDTKAGKVGVYISPPQIEDKLNGDVNE